MLSDYNTVGFWDILCSDGCQYRDSGLPGYDSVVWLTGADASEESWRQQVQQKRWYPSTTVQGFHPARSRYWCMIGFRNGSVNLAFIKNLKYIFFCTVLEGMVSESANRTIQQAYSISLVLSVFTSVCVQYEALPLFVVSWLVSGCCVRRCHCL